MSARTKKHPATQERINALMDVYLSFFATNQLADVKRLTRMYLKTFRSLKSRENALNKLILETIGDLAAGAVK
jgi:hypothetical protein